MSRTLASNPEAARALSIVEGLQHRFAGALQVATSGPAFESVSWERDGGQHGGGNRLVSLDSAHFDRASVNVSQVHYDDLPSKKLGSATALSTIIHPADPRAPSVHMHISWTQMRSGGGGWRLMADLNPALPNPDDTAAFEAALREHAKELYEGGRAQGDRYFFIPALDRHRGVSHFYVEGYASGDVAADCARASAFGEGMIDAYVEIFARRISGASPPTAAERDAQLAYHSVYLFQVLTLDRGTTSGLLVHDQNDVGILGSLPSHVDRERIASWKNAVPDVQRPLVAGILEALPSEDPSPVSVDAKRALARVVREHYRAHPEALAFQASGDVVPTTVDNHRS